MMNYSARVFFIIILITHSIHLSAADIVTLTAKRNDLEPLKTYNVRALALALDETRKEYGDYTLNVSKVVMTTARGIEEAKKNSFTNLLILTTFQNNLITEGLDYVRFPVDLGVTGYRIAFVSPAAKNAVAKVKSLDDLRKFTIAQGNGWADVEILRYNGFKVVEVNTFESLYNMVAINRVDLVFRGINELESELKSNKNIEGLDYDRSLAITYPLPRFYFSNSRNKRILQRITKGLLLAYNDGSLRKLWLEEFWSNLQFANLKNRRIYKLKTPNIELIDFNYEKYYFNPMNNP
jgi:hypothetical protein